MAIWKELFLISTIAVFVSSCGPGQSEEANSELENAGVVSGVVGLVKEVVFGHDDIEGFFIGEAIPKAENGSLELSGGKEKSQKFEKFAESALFRSDLFRIKYEIKYRFGSSHNKEGSYIENVMFLPLEVEVDPTITFKAKIVTEKPVNLNEGSPPIAGFSFHISWSVSTIGGSETKTDQFSIHGKSGKLTTKLRAFE